MANSEEENDLDEEVPEGEEEDFDEDFFLEGDEDLFSEEHLETEAPTTGDSEQPEETIAQEPEVDKMIPSNEIPLKITVEAGQIELTIEEFLKLEPGNLLETHLHPKDGVNLTINGKIVGKGELIRIGDVIGVRVLQLG